MNVSKKVLFNSALMFLASMLLLPVANADTMANVTVAMVGARDASGLVYFRISQALEQPCYGGLIGIDTTSSTGKYSFATVMTAYLAGKTGQWLDYTYSASTARCTLNQFDM